MELHHLEVVRDGPMCTVRLSGEPLGYAEAREIELVAEQIEEEELDDAPRVVILTTRGASWPSGPGSDLDPLTCGLDPPAAIASLSMPVIAVLHGRVASVGLELALATDVRVAGPGVVLAVDEVAAGALPCWGGTQRLVRLAGRSAAAMMLLAAEEFDLAAAMRCGLVQRSGDDADAVAGALAGELIARAPRALRAAKEAIVTGAELPMRRALEFEGDLNHLLQTTEDRAEGLAAFFDKRDPNFHGR